MERGSSGDAETNAVKTAAAACRSRAATTLRSSSPATSASSSVRVSQMALPRISSMPIPPGSATSPRWQPVYLWRPRQESEIPASLVKTFTYNGTFQCAPKDYSTLALAIKRTCGRQRA